MQECKKKRFIHNDDFIVELSGERRDEEWEKYIIVGAGPGDVDLITVKGMKCIQQADVILYDRLINKELLTYAKPGADLIYCGKLPNYHAMIQETINHFLVKYAKQGKIVTRLKGGDPFVFGRGAEEAEVLADNGIPFEVVPGITAGLQLLLMRVFQSHIAISVLVLQL